MLNIAIADDHRLFSQSLKQLLETEKKFNVVGIGRTGEELIDIVSRTQVNLVIVEYRMPGMDGVTACKKLRLLFPNLKIIMLSTFEEAGIANELKNIGVNGYFSKTSESVDFINAIYSIWEGKTIFPEYLSTATIKSFQPALTMQVTIDLTAREKEIISLISRGLTSQAIAANLFISINTVKGHRKNILKKLNLKNIQELVAYAIALGLC